MMNIRTSTIIITFLLLFSALTITLPAEHTATTQEETITTMAPIMTENTQGDLTISLQDSTTFTTSPGDPKLPTIQRTYTYPLGTTIEEVLLTPGITETISLSAEPEPTPYPQEMSALETITLPASYTKNKATYESTDPYPAQHYTYTTGAGLVDGTIQTILSITYNPIIYDPVQQALLIMTTADFSITTTPPSTIHQATVASTEESAYDLLILTPSAYLEDLCSFVNHKEACGVHTMVLTLADLSASHYPGRDTQEQIKYAIKDTVETYGIQNVLLIGDIYQMPIRTSHVKIMNFYIHPTISDLYYADLYNSDGTFSTWDTNQDNTFGESGEDTVDLYADVNLGRFPVSNRAELTVILDKILTYETSTYGSEWYHKITYIGGDTFPSRFDDDFEGEKHNRVVMEIMTDFTPRDIIWTSKGNFDRSTINSAINAGCGFVEYSGHGFEHGMGSYDPHKGHLNPYYTPYINDLNNQEKLPIIFFDACLTAKLDFTFGEFTDYKWFKPFRIFTFLPGIHLDNTLEVYASAMLKHPNGGAVATMGATRTAFGGEQFGCELLCTDFYNCYNTSDTLGEMLTQTQHTYRNKLPEDEFTIEEFILLGDPTLKLGGYPQVDPYEEPTPSTPVVTFSNPVKGYTYLRGEPQQTTHISLYYLADVLCFGSFNTANPIQIHVTDDDDTPQELTVSLSIDDQPAVFVPFNSDSGVHEYSCEIPLGCHTIKAIATDTDGHSDSASYSILRLM